MKLLTVRQPWAQAIFEAGKTIENRSFPTDYRGTVAIHAARADDDRALSHARTRDALRALLREHEQCDYDLEHGVILGTVELVVCAPRRQYITRANQWAQANAGFYWQLDEPRKISPTIPIRGQMGLREVPEHIETVIRRSYV